MLMHLPEGISFEQAAGFPEVRSFDHHLMGSDSEK
jgi:hypothetical protein